ncbi:MAG: ComEC/Rec2 family competence protein [Christensenella sp.]
MQRVLNSRPIVFFAFFLIVGIAVSYYLKLNVVFALTAFVICGIGFAALLFLNKRQMFAVLYLCAFFLGAFLFQIQFHTDFTGIAPNKTYEISGYVSDRSKMSSETHTYTLTDVKTDGNAFAKKVILYSPQKLDFGDTVTFKSEIKQPSSSRNSGDFDEEMYLAGKGAGFSIYGRSINVISNKLSWYQYPFLLREKLADNMDEMFSEESAPIAKAMFLGVKDEIPQEVRDSFAKTGIAHILAISGLHIAILSYALNFVLKKFRAARQLRFSLNIILLLLYMTITGFAPSILRAVLMTVFIIVGRWKFVSRDTFIFLGGALIVTLLINTAQLFSAGLLMSYGVVFGILCLNPPLMRLMKKAHIDKVKLDAPIATSLSATASVFPMTAYFFNNVALAAPIANLFAIPLAGIIVAFTGFSAMVSLAFLPIAQVLAFPAELSIRALVWLNSLMSSSAFGYIAIVGFPIWACIAVMAVIFVCSDYMLIKRRTKAVIAGVLIGATLFAGGVAMSAAPLKAVILDVGTGDAVHISAEGKNYLIDNGGNLQYSNINEYAEKNNISFDAVIVTNNKTKNLKKIAADGRIHMLYVPHNYQAKEYDADYTVKQYELYDKITLSADACLEAVGEDGKYTSFALRYKGKTVCLFLQTMPQDIVFTERAAVLKPMGGGKAGAVTEELLQTIQPKYAIISVKANNKKGLPSEDVLTLLENNNVQTYMTANSGAITITADGQVKIQTMK